MIINSVLLNEDEPFFVMGRDLEMCCPESSGSVSYPKNAVIARLLWKRLVSPISAISCGPVDSPTPYIPITTSYSGNVEDNRFISFFRAFPFSQAAFTNSAALAIIRQNVSSAETPATHFLA